MLILSICHAVIQTNYRFVCNFTVTNNIYQKSLFSLRSSNFSKISSFRRFLRLLKMIAVVLNSLSTGALDGITELKRRNTDLTPVCFFSMDSSRMESWRNCRCGWSDCSSLRSLKKSVEESTVVSVAALKVGEPLDSELLVLNGFQQEHRTSEFQFRIANPVQFEFRMRDCNQ